MPLSRGRQQPIHIELGLRVDVHVSTHYGWGCTRINEPSVAVCYLLQHPVFKLEVFEDIFAGKETDMAIPIGRPAEGAADEEA